MVKVMKIAWGTILLASMALSGCATVADIEKGMALPDESFIYRGMYFRILDEKMSYDKALTDKGCRSRLRDVTQIWHIPTGDEMKALYRGFHDNQFPSWLHNRIVDDEVFWTSDLATKTAQGSFYKTIDFQGNGISDKGLPSSKGEAYVICIRGSKLIKE